MGFTCSFVTALVLGPALLDAAALLAITAVTAGALAGLLARADAARAVGVAASFGALALLASYLRWLATAPQRRRDDDLERVRDLMEVNRLLLELHARAAASPESLDLRQAVAGAVSRLRQPLAPDALAVLLDAGGAVGAGGAEDAGWEVASCEGISLPPYLGRRDLPPAVLACVDAAQLVVRAELGPGEGLLPGAASGLYAPLLTGNRVVGLLLAERRAGPVAFGETEAEAVAPVARLAAVAVSNANLFDGIRQAGAQQERKRIARELHDRLGQTLAYVALSLDGLGTAAARQRALWAAQLGDDLAELATQVRAATRELRDELADLRRPETAGTWRDTLGASVTRTCRRWGVSCALDMADDIALTPQVAIAVARIAEEAIANAARHGGAGLARVRCRNAGGTLTLEVDDDGSGMGEPGSSPAGGYGIVGMRERASSLGGQLTVGKAPSGGVRVRLELPAPPEGRDRSEETVHAVGPGVAD